MTHSPALQNKFSTAEVARIAQVSLRQLQWWCEHDVVSPARDNHRRVYDSLDVLEILTLMALRRKALSLRQAGQVLRSARGELRRRVARCVGNAKLYLLTDGSTAYLEDNPERIVVLARKIQAPVCLVCLSDLMRLLQG